MVAELKSEKASRDNQDQAHWLLRANCGTSVGTILGCRVESMRCDAAVVTAVPQFCSVASLRYANRDYDQEVETRDDMMSIVS